MKNSGSKLLDEETNPCVKEHHLVNKCLVREDYDMEQCEHFYENYRRCKKFWNKVKLQRLMENKRPFMPGKAEREKIMQEEKLV